MLIEKLAPQHVLEKFSEEALTRMIFHLWETVVQYFYSS